VDGLDDRLFAEIEQLLHARFSPQSVVLPHGRVAVAVALSQARVLIQRGRLEFVLIAATDSLLGWPTVHHYEQQGRLLTGLNSDGFMPGEGAGALLLGKPSEQARLVCTGIGFGFERAAVDSVEPLRADGLAEAVRAALADSGSEMHEIDYRITDLSGEHYYFKESALALSRTLRRRKAEIELWHPAECTGECGATAGTAVIALAETACRRGFGKGPNILAHMTNDSGRRAALILQYRGAM
jgi:3-oxoacyl-[acyl-carrier-protein] synthase I